MTFLATVENFKHLFYNTNMSKKPKIIFGIDEAGRGPLAGPVTAAAIFININIKNQCLGVGHPNIRDSKKMTARQREKVFQFMKQESSVEWGIGRVGEKVIDKINILEASKLAMTRAVKNLEKKINKRADLLLIDGNFSIPIKRKQQSIIKGDSKVLIISLASIIAKVSRDQTMRNYHKKFPQYNFSQHKGYPTKQHYKTILTHGPCKLHRQSFRLKRI